MLLKFQEMLKSSMNKFSGNTDFLEAVCASAALVAAADGDISDDEVMETIKTIQNNPNLSGAFSASEIEKTSDAMFKRANGGRSGRMGLYVEIEESAGKSGAAEVILLCAIDVADADNDISAEETKVLEKIAKQLGLELQTYMDM